MLKESIVSLHKKDSYADERSDDFNDIKRSGSDSMENEFLGQCSTVTLSLFVYVHFA